MSTVKVCDSKTVTMVTPCGYNTRAWIFKVSLLEPHYFASYDAQQTRRTWNWCNLNQNTNFHLFLLNGLKKVFKKEMLDVGIKGTLQEIALKVAEQQMKEQETENTSKERTIFVLGSKEVVSFNLKP